MSDHFATVPWDLDCPATGERLEVVFGIHFEVEEDAPLINRHVGVDSIIQYNSAGDWYEVQRTHARRSNLAKLFWRYYDHDIEGFVGHVHECCSQAVWGHV